MGNLGNKEIMAKNIRHYMEKYNKTRQEMCDALGVKYTTFTDWVKGNSYPRIDKIELMANYFGISKADLVEERYCQDSGTIQRAAALPGRADVRRRSGISGGDQFNSGCNADRNGNG